MAATIDHDFEPTAPDGRCRVCGGAPSTRPEHTSPRSRFNAAALELGLTIDHFSSDGWARSFTRADGLHLWRISDYYHGIGIQTAWIDPNRPDRYVDHQPFYKGDFLTSLRAAVLRPTERT